MTLANTTVDTSSFETVTVLVLPTVSRLDAGFD